MTGIMAGLLDPVLHQKKELREGTLRKAVEDNSEYRAKWGDAWEQIERAQFEYADFFERYSALEGRRRAIRSDLFAIAKNIVRLAEELPKPSGERLREFRDSELDSLYLELYSPAPIYEELEIARIANGLTALAQALGAKDPLVVAALHRQSPEACAAGIVAGSKLKDVAVRKQLVEGGRAAIESTDDPLIKLALALEPETRKLRKRYEDVVESAETEGYAKIAAAQFAVLGQEVYPDATFTLRYSFGPIQGYADQGETIPPYTTLNGVYQRMEERRGIEPFQLPKRWLEGKQKLDLSTPFNFICTPDIIGGNSGSPVVNTNGEVIGLIFDGNIHSLVYDLAYTEAQARAVAVDSRAIIETLRKLYDAKALADELTGN